LIGGGFGGFIVVEADDHDEKAASTRGAANTATCTLAGARKSGSRSGRLWSVAAMLVSTVYVRCSRQRVPLHFSFPNLASSRDPAASGQFNLPCNNNKSGSSAPPAQPQGSMIKQ